MPNAKILTYVKDHTIGLKKGERRNHLSHIQGLIKAEARTYSDLFKILDSDKAWMGASKQPLKTLLSGTLSALRKNGAIKDSIPPKDQILDGLKAVTMETAAARAERIAARVAARKAANKERYNKMKLGAYLAQIKDDQQTAEIQALKDKLAISDANATAAIERADKAEAQVSELEKALNSANIKLADGQIEFQETVEEWRAHSQQLEITIYKLEKERNSYSFFFLFNLIFALFGAYYLGIAFPDAYKAAATIVATNYQLALNNAPILYKQALDSAQPVLDYSAASVQPALDYVSASAQPILDYAAASAQPILDYATASARPVINYASTSAQPYINYLLDI
jgi:hypothetical protein